MPDKKQWQDQEVSVALELLISTLADERKRIYDVGANAMKAQDGDTALAVINFAKKLEGFQEKVKVLSTDWAALIDEKISAPEKVQQIVDGDGKLFGMRTRKSKTGFTRKVEHPIAPKTNFTVQFSDGTIISNPKACDTLVQTIERIGEQRVQALGLICAGEPLVSDTQSKKYKASSKKTVAGFYVQTQSSTAAKVKYLQTISAKLKINLSIIADEVVLSEELPGISTLLQTENPLTGDSWLISANGNLYDHEGAFDKFGYIDWRQNNRRYQVGDIVYIYCTRPICKVRYMAIIEQEGMSFDEITDDREFWSDPTKYEEAQSGTYVRLRLLKKKDSEELNLDALRAHGLYNAPQGPIKVKAELDEFLKQNFAE